jgi:hypothetical protein
MTEPRHTKEQLGELAQDAQEILSGVGLQFDGDTPHPRRDERWQPLPKHSRNDAGFWVVQTERAVLADTVSRAGGLGRLMLQGRKGDGETAEQREAEVLVVDNQNVERFGENILGMAEVAAKIGAAATDVRLVLVSGEDVYPLATRVDDREEALGRDIPYVDLTQAISHPASGITA